MEDKNKLKKEIEELEAEKLAKQSSTLKNMLGGLRERAKSVISLNKSEAKEIETQIMIESMREEMERAQAETARAKAKTMEAETIIESIKEEATRRIEAEKEEMARIILAEREEREKARREKENIIQKLEEREIKAQNAELEFKQAKEGFQKEIETIKTEMKNCTDISQEAQTQLLKQIKEMKAHLEEYNSKVKQSQAKRDNLKAKLESTKNEVKKAISERINSELRVEKLEAMLHAEIQAREENAKREFEKKITEELEKEIKTTTTIKELSTIKEAKEKAERELQATRTALSRAETETTTTRTELQNARAETLRIRNEATTNAKHRTCIEIAGATLLTGIGTIAGIITGAKHPETINNIILGRNYTITKTGGDQQLAELVEGMGLDQITVTPETLEKLNTTVNNNLQQFNQTGTPTPYNEDSDFYHNLIITVFLLCLLGIALYHFRTYLHGAEGHVDVDELSEAEEGHNPPANERTPLIPKKREE